jgi:hypothetical protein
MKALPFPQYLPIKSRTCVQWLLCPQVIGAGVNFKRRSQHPSALVQSSFRSLASVLHFVVVLYHDNNTTFHLLSFYYIIITCASYTMGRVLLKVRHLIQSGNRSCALILRRLSFSETAGSF